MATIINTVAWVLCGVVGFLLFGDFIKTEMQFKKEQNAQKEVRDNESGNAD